MAVEPLAVQRKRSFSVHQWRVSLADGQSVYLKRIERGDARTEGVPLDSGPSVSR